MTEQLRVIAAAVKIGDKVFSLPPPARHHNVFPVVIRSGVKPPIPTQSCGFLLSDGTFVDRYRALEVARAAGQVTKLIGSILTSEDLW